VFQKMEAATGNERRPAVDDTIRYDTIEEFNVDSKAEYTA